MKKLFSILCAFVISSVVFFAGCSDKWTEVQSITYHTDSGAKTYTSMIYYNVTTEYITQEEYNELPENQKRKFCFKSSYLREIDVNRKQFIDEFNKDLENNNVEIGKVYYSTYYEETDWEQKSPVYIKYIINYQELRYIKIKFTDNDWIEINYYEGGKSKIIHVKPASYEITYFED